MNDLPQNWIDCRLGDVVDYGKTRKYEPDDIPGDSWVLELEDIERGTSRLLDRQTFAQRQSKSTKNGFDAGDVLYGKLRPYLNKVLIADRPGYCTTEIVPLKAGPYLDGRYLFYWLKHPTFLAYVEAESHGLNMPRLGTDTGRAAPFVFAPRPEQTRIADKLDAVLPRVDACRDRIDRIPVILKRFRQSVLAAATSGKLTEDWRTENDLSTDDWEICSLGSLVETSANGLSKRRADVGNETTVLRLADFKNSERIWGNERTIRLDGKEVAKYGLASGDLLVVRVNGSADLAGRFIVYEPHREQLETYCDHFIRLRLDTRRINPRFIRFIANSGAGRRYIESVLVTSAGQKTINKTSLFELGVALPSVSEQTEIIRRVENLFAFADRLEARYTAAHAQVEKLTPSLLAKAFRGELVPQDPNDEPASLLLSRLRQSAQKLEPIRPSRGRRK